MRRPDLEELRARRGARTPRAASPVSLPQVLWVTTAVIVTILVLRFGMRTVGVRDDIALPGLVYTVTAPLVGVFYRFFPVSPRFDYPAIEFASLAAAGVVVGFALGIYVFWLLFSRRGP